MTCSHCGTYFCWLCGMRLNLTAPYLHYSNPESKCYEMLYRGVIPDEMDEPEDNVYDLGYEFLPELLPDPDDYYYTDDEDIYDEYN